MRTFMLTVAILLAAYVAWLALLYVGQRSMMFPGAGLQVDAGRYPLLPGAETVVIPAGFGQVRGFLLRAPSSTSAPALLYFHGNAELAVQNIALLQPLTDQGLHVLIVEYPGYADSDGRPGRDTLDEAARVGFDWLAQRTDVDPARIVAVGRSIGTGPAVALARERPVAALVLLSGFSSLDGFAHGMGAPAFLLRDRYDNAAALRRYPRPVLLFHGHRDRIIPYAHAQALAQAAPDARLVTLECGHNDCPYFDAAFVSTLGTFLRESRILPPN
jgi:fermentation-respiration switch protein FrsA (DUF1100 family)